MMRGGPHLASLPSDTRAPPFNLEAEQALLGAVLLNNAALDRAEGLNGDHFYDSLHGEIFDVLRQLIGRGSAATPITLRTYFEGHAPVGNISVPQYLGTLAGQATTIINVADYAQTIRELSTRRSLIVIGEDMVNDCYDAAVGVPPQDLIEETESKLLALVQDGPQGKDEISFNDAVTSALQKASDAYKRGGGLRGLSTGLKDLDDKLGGMAPSDLIILGGRPGMGKTALATTIAINVALEHMRSMGKRGAHVHFFSQEMSADQLATRVIAQYAEVPADKIGRGKIDDKQFARMAEAAEFLRNASFTVDQTGGLSLAQLQARARRLKRKKGTGLIIVDYLQLMHGTSKENRNQDVTKITNGLKALAKELDVPILALSQLSRQVENREEKRPTLSDLRESGSIEQDADIVIFVFREEYYVQLKKPGDGDIEKLLEWQAELAKVEGKAEAILAKHRHGPTGSVNLAFNSQFTAFGNMAREHHLNERYQ